MTSVNAIRSLALVVISLAGLHSVLCAEEAPISERFARRDTNAVPDFQRHVIPLLGRLGCNSAKCHGSFQGQGGFRLSLFGFDFASDHRALLSDATSTDEPRLNRNDPGQSLFLRKPTEQVDHEGGKRLEPDSWEYNLLWRWIESGAEGADFESGSQPEPGVNRETAADRLFREEVRPIFETHCAECHSEGDPKASLRLTSREDLLQGGKTGPSIVPGKPEASLLIQAIRYANQDLQMPPSGKLDPEEIEAVEKWIQLGAPWSTSNEPAAGETGQVLVRLEFEPPELLFSEQLRQLEIQVFAVWESGVREEVTSLSRFQTNDSEVATIDSRGRVASLGSGDTHIVIFYDNGVAAIPVMRPYQASNQTAARSAEHPIDRFVEAKLAKLGVIPSPVCTDSEFLRRLSIDLTGSLPTPAEVEAFLADPASDKRQAKVDEMLTRPSYAACWANKLCDFTGCSPAAISSLLEVATEQGYRRASEWYDWIYERVASNEPYDELVAGIMLADPRSEVGDRMPHFWARQSLQEPKDTAMSVAHAFLGIQLQCAECHKHPFDRWTQADFQDFARFFESVPTGRHRAQERSERQLRLLRSRNVNLSKQDDPRGPILDWMRDPQNPWFARAFVNRVWAGYFHVGIVEPPDQFTPANPPSNPQLLDWLTTGFIQSGYDMKWLHRQIVTSDTYQRSWRPNDSNRVDRRNFSRAIPRRVPAEVVYDALKQATAATDELAEVRTNLRRRATGHLSMRMAGTHAMRVFGKPTRAINCDCERVNQPNLLQAIFMQNDPLVRMRVADSGWVYEIAEQAEGSGKSPDHTALVREVWLRTVSRPPRPAELRRATRHLESVETLSEGLQDLLWAMLNTKEFLLNH